MSNNKTLTPRSVRIQSNLAIASFTIGVILACICLFVIEPYGEIHTSAMGVVSELFILAGSLLGINVNFDLKMRKFKADVLKDMHYIEGEKDIDLSELPDE